MTRKTIFTAIAVCFVVVQSCGQNYKLLQKAFAESYKAEAAGEYSRAIELLRKEFNENSYATNLRLGWLTYLNGAFTESVSYYNRAIQLMPMSIEARLGFALPASAMGNWDDVVTRYQEIIKIDPNHYLTNYRLGLIYYNREEFQQALRFFERIANLYPFDYDAMIMFAWTNFNLGRMKEAQLLFNKVLLIRPDDYSATMGLSLIK